MLTKKITAMAGAGLLVSGCFLPILNVMGNPSGFLDPLPVRIPDIPENTLKYCTAIIMAIAVISAALALLRLTKFLWISGIVSASFLACVFLGMKIKIDQLKEESDHDLDKLFGGMFKSVVQSLFDKVEIAGLGWYVISAGAILLIFASIIRTEKPETIDSR